MHLTAAKRVLRYPKTTKNLRLFYPASTRPISGFDNLRGFTDSDWARRTSTRKSVGVSIFMDGGPISWQEKSQSVVALSTLEAEVIAALGTIREAIWFRRMRNAVSEASSDKPVRVACDNQGGPEAYRYGRLQGENQTHRREIPPCA